MAATGVAARTEAVSPAGGGKGSTEGSEPSGAARPGRGCCGPAGVCLGLRCVPLSGGGRAVHCGSCSAGGAERLRRVRGPDYKSRKPPRPSVWDGVGGSAEAALGG